MNKSKFLKKSLAAILAVLMIVAVVPLSAAAYLSLPTFDMLYVGPHSGTQAAIEFENDKFSADIPSGTTNVDISVNATFLNDTLGNSIFGLEIVNPDSVTTTTTLTNVALANVAKKNDAGNWEITLRLYDLDDAARAEAKTYTLELTESTKNTTALLDVEKTVPVGNTGVYTVSANENTCVLTVQVARDATAPQVKLVAKNGAAIAPSNVNGVNFASGTTMTATESAANNKHFVITSESGQNTSEWTVKVEVVDSLKTFTLGGYEGVISDEGSGHDDTVTVTLPRSVLTNEHGDALTNLRLDVAFSVYGNVTEIKMDKNGTTSGQERTVDTDGTNNPFYFGTSTGNELYPTNTLWTTGNAGIIKVPCGKNGSTQCYQQYDLVITVEKDNDTEIKYVSVDDIEATIVGNRITAVLPSIKKGTASTETELDKVVVEIETGTSVVSVNLEHSATASHAGFSKNGAAVNGVQKWYSSTDGTATVDLDGKEKIITVTAEDGTVKNYILSASISTNDHEAVMTDLTLGNGADAIKGVLSGKTFTFTLPYMTLDTDLNTLPIYATVNPDAYAVIATGKDSDNNITTTNGNPTTIRNGYVYANDLMRSVTLNASGDRTVTAGNFIRVINKNNAEKWEDYNVKFVLQAPVTARPALTSMTISAQKDSPIGEKNYTVYDRVESSNTFTATPSSVSGLAGKLVFEPAFSLSSAVGVNGTTPTAIYNTITDIKITNSGTAFLGLKTVMGNGNVVYEMKNGNKWLQFTNAPTISKFGTPGIVSTLTDDGETFNSSGFINDYSATSNGDVTTQILIVAPEEYARVLKKEWNNDQQVETTDSITLADGSAKTFAQIISECMVYTISDSPKDASNQAALTKFVVKDTELTVRNNVISGTLPYSATSVSGSTGNAINAQYIDFTISPYAEWENFYSKGDKNNDGYTDALDAVDPTKNLKIIFERNADKTVTAYFWDGTTKTQIDGSTDAKSIVIKAENRLDSSNNETASKFTFDLKWADPNTESKITSFTLAGSRGTIVDSTDSTGTINVRVPYKTDMKSLIPTFTTSSGATVTLKNGNSLTSGNVTLDFSNPVVVTVLSEDGNSHRDYTITVVEGSQFDDVSESDWFYPYVMAAAENDWIQGTAAGTFSPYNPMTRGQFATIIARIMEYDEDDYTESAFSDVDSESYYSAAIAFCKENGYINGFDDGTFRPDVNITREQAAVIMCNAAGLTAIPGATEFNDDATIADWAKPYVNACVANRIISGKEGNRFDPKTNLRRCEGATLLVNAFN